MIEFTESEISKYYAWRVPRMNQRGREWRGNCPIHDGKNLNFSVNSGTGMAHCHSKCQRGWDVIGLEMQLAGADFPTAKAAVFQAVGRPAVPYQERDVEAVFDYRDEHGVLRYQVLRKWGKKFVQRRPLNGDWAWNLDGVEYLPFNLADVIPADLVWIVEGEKDVLTLRRIGIAATCNNGGAEKFRPDLARWFAGKDIAILPDNDEPGRRHALKVADTLAAVAASIRIVELPCLPPKGDVSDFVASGGTRKLIEQAYADAQEWFPGWQFTTEITDENDKYVRTFARLIEESGGLQKFWTVADQEGLPTPFSRLTESLGGMRRGEVYVIGGDQGSGKTSLGLQFMIHALLRHSGVLLFSMEMGWREVYQRLAAIRGRVDLQKFRWFQKQGAETDEYRAMRHSLQAATAELCATAVQVSNKMGVSPEYLISETERLSKRQAIDLVVVDHMQLMSATKSVRGDYEKFTAISRACKETAMQIRVPLLLISQTSRSHSADKRTELEVHDLRGSGAIEEDAAGIMLLYPDKRDCVLAHEENRFSKGPVIAWLKLAKNRYGESGKYVKLDHWKGRTTFELPLGDANA